MKISRPWRIDMTTMCYTPAGMKPNLDHLSAALVFILLAVSMPAQSEAESPFRQTIEENLEYFGLFNTCKPVSIWVSELSSDAKEISLRKADIENIVESRLRSARIFLELDKSWFLSSTLFINVAVVGAAFMVDIDFSKPMRDETLEHTQRVRTWGTNILGTHGRNADYILSAVRSQTEEFVADYLRVNDEAC